MYKKKKKNASLKWRYESKKLSKIKNRYVEKCKKKVPSRIWSPNLSRSVYERVRDTLIPHQAVVVADGIVVKRA